MKYSNYLINGTPINPDELGIIAIPSAIVGLIILTGLLPGAYIIDSGRILKLKYILYQREQRRINYIRCVLISLDRKPNNQLIDLLRAA